MSGINPIDPKLGFPCPLTLTCTVTGNTVVYSDPEYIRGRIEKAGGLDVLLKTFVSKAGKSQMKEGQPKPVRSTRMWKGQPVVQAQPSPAAVIPPPEGRVSHLFLHQDTDGFCWISRSDGPRQNPEQKPVIVHDFRSKKNEPFDSKGFSTSTIKQLRELGVALA
jgi:hypothetical protein